MTDQRKGFVSRLKVTRCRDHEFNRAGQAMAEQFITTKVIEQRDILHVTKTGRRVQHGTDNFDAIYVGATSFYYDRAIIIGRSD